MQRKSPHRMASKGLPNPIDIHVGQRIRERRKVINMTQQKLAALMGLTFQQVQKYESGTNRVGSSRLFDLARILTVTVSYFFEGLPMHAEQEIKCSETSTLMQDDSKNKEVAELVKAFSRISNKEKRKKIIGLIRELGSPPYNTLSVL